MDGENGLQNTSSRLGNKRQKGAKEGRGASGGAKFYGRDDKIRETQAPPIFAAKLGGSQRTSA